MNVPNFVGRESDINLIEEQFLHVMTAQPRVLLIEGIADMGKSRLVEEIASRAKRHDMRIAVGRCYEDMAQPYDPFRSLLVHFEEANLLDDSGSSFLRLLAGRATHAAEVLTADGSRPEKRLFMNVAQAMITLASKGPLVLIVEDLHWADPSTLDLFDYMAFALAEDASVPLLLVGTYRPTKRESRLGWLLERLQIERVVKSLALSGLDESETRHLLRELRVRRATQQVVQMVHQATHGIPSTQIP